MPIEIELKFSATHAATKLLPEVLTEWQAQICPLVTLNNIYYETDDRYLRNHEIGLRVRSQGSHYEMTLKSEGKTIAGLHQRSEHNIPLDNATLDISLLPDSVWPEHCNISKLSKALNPLFATDFERQCWLIFFEESKIELALDIGFVKAGEQSVELCEVELELLSGNESDLLLLAYQLIEKTQGMRLSNKSKAARGYQLAYSDNQTTIKALPILTTVRKTTIEQGMIDAMEMALAHWQYHEDLWFKGNQQAKKCILESIALVRQNWALFGGIIPRKASAELRQELEQLETSLINSDTADGIIWKTEYQQFKLALTHWLLSHHWQLYCSQKSKDKLAGSFKRFADVMLSRCAAELKAAFKTPLDEQGYKDQIRRLSRQLLSVHMLAGAYSSYEREQWLAHWQALFNEINKDNSDNNDLLRKKAIAATSFWLSSTRTSY